MRIDYGRVLPGAVQAMSRLEQVVHDSTLEPELLELVKMRASQLNGCAYWLDMHSKDALALVPRPWIPTRIEFAHPTGRR